MTQAELATRTGIRPSTINDMYHELAERVSLEYLDRICEVLDCELGELMERVPNRVPRTGKHLIVEAHGREEPDM